MTETRTNQTTVSHKYLKLAKLSLVWVPYCWLKKNLLKVEEGSGSLTGLRTDAFGGWEI